MRHLGLASALAILALVPASAAESSSPLTLALSVGPGPPSFNSELWLTRPDGRVTTRIVRTKRVGISDPAWSPSGNRIAFVVVRDPLMGTGGSIVIADADGRQRRSLARGFAPAWSPDGRTIAFYRTSDNGPSIWLMRSDGRGQRRLTAGIDPAWSPDGRSLALSSGGWISVVNHDGSRVRQVTAAPTDCDMPDAEQGGTDLDPEWSPTGERITFVRDCDELSGGSLDRIMLVNADGSDLHPVTRGPDDSSPSWSPDGRLLAFVRTFAVHTTLPEGTHGRTVFDPPRHEVYQVAWLRGRRR